MNLLPEIKKFTDKLDLEYEFRNKNAETEMSFGISYFDDALEGIYANDLVLIGAKSGMGKTELATQIAVKNAELGKRVMYFALEAENGEIERRIRYRYVSKYFYNNVKNFPGVNLRYASWYYGKYKNILKEAEDYSRSSLTHFDDLLTTFYRNTSKYTVHDFAKHFHALKDKADMFIVDHVHYFDSDEPNENRALKETMQTLRDCALLGGKAIVLVAHLRKSDRKFSSPVPDLEDFHGTSDIGKIATKAISIAQAPGVEPDGTAYPTLFKIMKSRVGSDVERILAMGYFDIQMNMYRKSYEIGKIENGIFAQERDKSKWPSWAKAPTSTEFGRMK
jgi:archaellum biogenesis ATPase FlaH